MSDTIGPDRVLLESESKFVTEAVKLEVSHKEVEDISNRTRSVIQFATVLRGALA
jgi:hypothetical protein